MHIYRHSIHLTLYKINLYATGEVNPWSLVNLVPEKSNKS